MYLDPCPHCIEGQLEYQCEHLSERRDEEREDKFQSLREGVSIDQIRSPMQQVFVHVDVENSWDE